MNEIVGAIIVSNLYKYILIHWILIVFVIEIKISVICLNNV